jgi:VWFA-related protein
MWRPDREVAMRWMGVTSVSVLVGAITAGGTALMGQETPSPRAKVTAAVRVNVVNVEVVVTDSNGRRVRGLTANDFKVFEDGAPVRITNFFAAGSVASGARAVTPTPAAETATPTPERAPALPEPPVEEKALSLVVFVDNANLAYSGRKAVLDNVAKVLDGVLQPGDRVMVVSYDLSMKENRSFTTDPAAAKAALKAVANQTAEGVMTTAQKQRLMDRMARDSGMGIAPPSSLGFRSQLDADVAVNALMDIQAFAEEQFAATRTQLKTLSRFVDSLAGLPGHKAVIYVSQGIAPRPCEELFIEWETRFPEAARSLQRPDGGRGAVLGPAATEAAIYSLTSELHEIEHRANAGRVTFITINASSDLGMEGTSAETMALSAQPGLAAMEAMKRQQSLLDFARATGGRSLINNPALVDTLAAAAEDLHSFYSIGYSPEHFGDDRYHRITVEVKVPDLTLRHREGYLDKSPQQRLMDRTAGALLAEGTSNPLGIAVTTGRAVAGQGETLLVPLTVKVPASRLTLLPQGGTAEGRVSVVLVVKDEQGRASDPQRVEIPMRVPLDKLDGMLKQEASFSFQLMMKEGKHRVAVTLQDEITEEVSTVVAEVTVPSRAFVERRP